MVGLGVGFSPSLYGGKVGLSSSQMKPVGCSVGMSRQMGAFVGALVAGSVG
jgi:hypothetical protein